MEVNGVTVPVCPFFPLPFPGHGHTRERKGKRLLAMSGNRGKKKRQTGNNFPLLSSHYLGVAKPRIESSNIVGPQMRAETQVCSLPDRVRNPPFILGQEGREQLERGKAESLASKRAYAVATSWSISHCGTPKGQSYDCHSVE